jgi:hypothetical protein
MEEGGDKAGRALGKKGKRRRKGSFLEGKCP